MRSGGEHVCPKRERAHTFPSGDGGRAPDDRTRGEARASAGESGSRQGLREWGVLGLAVGSERAPHIPVIDRRHQTGGRFTRDQFRYEPAENVYYCPEGKPLRYRGQRRDSQGYAYCSTAAQCQGCPQKKRCTSAPYRWLFVHGQESARQAVRALVGTPSYERSRRARYKVEALFAELKQRMHLHRARLRRLWNVAEQFHLAATAQNLKRLVQFLVHRQLQPELTA